jgi:hypothetical protein
VEIGCRGGQGSPRAVAPTGRQAYGGVWSGRVLQTFRKKVLFPFSEPKKKQTEQQAKAESKSEIINTNRINQEMKQIED